MRFSQTKEAKAAELKPCFNKHIRRIPSSFVSLLPSGVNGLAEQEGGRCSGGDTHHSASESVL